MVYQPQVSLRTGRVLGFEALMRWHHPRLGWCPRRRSSIPIAEEIGSDLLLGVWALRRACQDVVAWQANGMDPLRLAVNVSPRQLQHEDLRHQVAQVLADTGLPRSGWISS